MTTRLEILKLARRVADAVADSPELAELVRCEAALGRPGGAPLDPSDPDPAVRAYLEARERAERLMHQVTNVFFFPLTGHLLPLQGEGGCVHCGG